MSPLHARTAAHLGSIPIVLVLALWACGQALAGDADAASVDGGGCTPTACGTDGGSSGPDASPPADAEGVADARSADGGRCEGLGPAACLGAGCVPTFDDSCCPVCESGACADCLHWSYFVCRPYRDACEAAYCSRPPRDHCAGEELDCSGAHPNAVDACDVEGCVPAYAPGDGAPDPATASCVPLHAQICTVACRRLPPICPSGTVPEGDGSCYTNRCIPAFVCG